MLHSYILPALRYLCFSTLSRYHHVFTCYSPLLFSCATFLMLHQLHFFSLQWLPYDHYLRYSLLTRVIPSVVPRCFPLYRSSDRRVDSLILGSDLGYVDSWVVQTVEDNRGENQEKNTLCRLCYVYNQIFSFIYLYIF